MYQIILTILSYICVSSASEQGYYEWSIRPVTSYPVLDTILASHVRRQLGFVHMMGQCAYHCHRDYYCRSFNYYRDHHLCELNYADHEQAPESVQSVTGAEYHKITEFKVDKSVVGSCSNNECPQSGLCVQECAASGGESECICFNDKTRNTDCQERKDPAWSMWSEWQECSVTCGNGYQARVRQCLDPHNHNRTLSSDRCIGKPSEYRTCSGGGGLDSSSCPHWKAWSEWSECTSQHTCGVGTMNRTRECSNKATAADEGDGCLGHRVETSRCHMPECNGAIRLVGAGVYGEGVLQMYDKSSQTWGLLCNDGNSFSLIDAAVACRQAGMAGTHPDPGSVLITSGQFVEVRHTVLVQNISCRGDEASLQQCRHHPWHTNVDTCGKAVALRCQVDGGWSPWSTWSECSVTCDNGTQARQRSCNQPPAVFQGSECEGSSEEAKACRLKGCSRWEAWSPWSPCDVTCGNGTQVRRRKCYDEFAKEASDCEGESNDFRICVTANCAIDGIYEEWSEWTPCSHSCGEGKQHRSRNCKGPFNGGKPCEGDETEEQKCNMNSCSVNGYWAEWGDWQRCPKTCGEAVLTVRKRTCIEPLHGGLTCTGDAEESKVCMDKPCPIDGNWDDWGEWSDCSASCGGGMQSRSRNCNLPQNGGQDCIGDAEESKTCNDSPCPVDGYWSEWGEFGECSSSCGAGVKTRTRTCHPPTHGGKECAGDSTDTADCTMGDCPVDGVWLEWSIWSECSASCNGGNRIRNRECQPPTNGGKECVGNIEESEMCNDIPCPVHGVWLEWGDWSECAVTCGGGTIERTRVCEPPQHGGDDCQGDATEREDCATNACPIPGDWFSWSAWSECSVTCLGGTRHRSRECDVNTHGDLTLPCEGDDSELDVCNTNGCILRSCEDLKQQAVNVRTGWYNIDPDGADYGFSPFSVYCDFDSKPGEGVTIIGHNQEARTHVTDFEGPGEYMIYIKYNNTEEEDEFDNEKSTQQVRNLVKLSTYCEQFVKWECKSSSMTSEQGDYKITYWLNWREFDMDYWGGAEPRSMSCACGMTDSCAKPGLKCNCDANDDVWREDSGYITQIEDLPVRGFAAGDTGEPPEEQGYRTIGRLSCWGLNDISLRLDSAWAPEDGGSK